MQAQSCPQFTDNFGSSTSLSNYTYYDADWNPSSAAALSFGVASNELQESPSGTTDYSYLTVNNAQFPQNLSSYTDEGDFELGTGGQGVFGLMVLATAATGYGYIFQWNGLNGRWELEKQTALNGTGYYYPGCNSTNPYTLGTWVHLKVSVSGGVFNAWETPESAPGVPNGPTVQIFTNITDTVACPGLSGLSAPYTSGAAGVRVYNVVSGNTFDMANYTVYACTTPTPTPTATPTPAGCSIGTWTANGSAIVSSNAVTFPGTDTSGSAWNNTPLNLSSSFDMTFPVYLGPNSSAADGVAFLLQTEGLNAIGGWGGGMGFGNSAGTVPATPVSPSVDVPIDTWDDPGPPEDDPLYDHLSVLENGVLGNWIAGPVAALPSQANVDDGTVHSFRVVWNAPTTTLSVYFDGNLRLTLTQDFVNQVFGGTSNVYWGFTGSANEGEWVGLPCQGLPTPTPTSTATATPSATPASTGTPCGYPGNTCTPTFTATPTATPVVADVFEVYENILQPAQHPVTMYVDYTTFPGPYSLRIYNSAGEHIRTLDDRTLNQPVNQYYSWDGTNKYGSPCASGVYIIYLTEPYGVKLKKILLIR